MFKKEIKILIVDDMMTIRRLVKRSLVTMGFANFDEAADGDLAWQKLAGGSKFDLIISDWNMPNCSGLELLKKVRATPELAAMPFVLLTAEAEAHQVREALIAGVDTYVLKPFTVVSLQEKLEQVAAKRAGLRAA